MNIGIIRTKKAKDPNENLRLYKYMILKTYFKMLMNRSLRMNSIILMNDESKPFFLSDELCNIYTGDGIEEKKMFQLFRNHKGSIAITLRVDKEKVSITKRYFPCKMKDKAYYSYDLLCDRIGKCIQKKTLIFNHFSCDGYMME